MSKNTSSTKEIENFSSLTKAAIICWLVFFVIFFTLIGCIFLLEVGQIIYFGLMIATIISGAISGFISYYAYRKSK